MNNSNRIEILREHALNRIYNNVEWSYLSAKGYNETYFSELSTACRYAKASEYMFENVQVVIDNCELVVGKPSFRDLSKDEKIEWENILKYSQPAKPRADGQTAHMSVNYELLLKKGAQGIIDEIFDSMGKLDLTIPKEIEKYDFYKSCISALNGMCKLSERYADLALIQAENCLDEERKKELLTISEICRNVPKRPAKTFYEAIQSIHFLTFCLSITPLGLYQLGHPDRYLIEYFKNDIKNGTLTKIQAQTLLDCLGILYNEYIPRGVAVGYMVGGRDESGKDVTNELSYMLIETIGNVRMIYPAVGLCYNSDTPDDLLELSCDMIGRGHTHPAIFNDDVIIKGLQYYGLPYNEACNYIHSTCVEITPCNSSACWVASPYTNLVQLLLDTMGIDVDKEECVEFDTFDELEQAYYNNLSRVIKDNLIAENRLQIERTNHFYFPLLSCFVDDCLKLGMDIESGGARYNWLMPSFVGLANVADSFNVINELIFKHKKITFMELSSMLKNNFVGYEAQRLLINNYVEKYGNDDDSVDNYVNKMAEWLNNECLKYTTYRGGKLIPSLFCWIKHDKFGSQTMASPDGRQNGFPLGDGSGPAQGREKNGPTASILSSTKWDHSPFIGGVAINMKFSKKLFNDESKQKLIALVKTFINRGGFEIQINTIDKETLLKARLNPELYSDLVVRIGGYSDYFAKLSPSMQAEVIERTTHEI